MSTRTSGDPSNQKVVGDLDANLAALLCYSLTIVSGAIFYLIEEDNDFVRFHAAQSVVAFGGLIGLRFAISIAAGIMGFVPVVGGLFSTLAGLANAVIGLAVFVLWLVLMIKAYQGERYELPIAGDFANDLA